MQLTATNVHEILMDCFFKDGEDTTGYVLGHGVMVNLGFHPERLASHKQEIEELVDQLPESFKQGDSFLHANVDKEGRQWADLHTTMDELVCLGTAIGKISYPLPRSTWHTLLGGVPYLMIN